MSLHTPTDLATLARKHGWTTPGDQTTAVAIMLAASAGWDSRDGGLFLLGGTPGDAAGQVDAAHAAYLAKGWDAFSVYRAKLYLLFMPVASAAVTASNATAVASVAVDAAGSTIDDVTDAAGKLGGDLLSQARAAVAVLYKASAWLGNSDNWSRIATVVVGGAMILVGLNMLVTQEATKILPAVLGGKVGKVAQLAGQMTEGGDG